MTDRPQLVLVDDHVLIAEALAVALRGVGFEVAVLPVEGVADDELLAQVHAVEPGLVLLDVHLGDGRVAVPLIRPLVASGVPVVVLTASRDATTLGSCITAGATGLVDKGQPFKELAELVRSALEGVPVLSVSMRVSLLDEAERQHRARAASLAPFRSLTPREQHVLAELMAGCSADTIAAHEDISVATVRTHIRALLAKLGVNTQLSAVVMAYRAGWAPTD